VSREYVWGLFDPSDPIRLKIWPHPPKRGHAGGVHACGVLSRSDRCASRAPGTRASRALIAQSAPKSFQGWELTPGSPGVEGTLRNAMSLENVLGKYPEDSPVWGGACKRWLSLPPACLTLGLPDSKLARLLAEHPRSS